MSTRNVSNGECASLDYGVAVRSAPLLAATGMLMWQWTRLRKLLTTFLGSTPMPWQKHLAGLQGKR
jgi:hypothetical protein